MPTRTLGIDLASQPRHTAACVIEWTSPRARVTGFHTSLDDTHLLALLDDPAVTKAGIDAPFGWPLEFAEAIHAYAAGAEWPDVEPRRLTLRATDRVVREVTGRDPLSVSTDKISFTAMRCARLLTEYGRRHRPVDRRGAGRLVEVYPAAALRQWGFDPRGYKGTTPERRLGREALIQEVRFATSSWLRLKDADLEGCSGSDHSFDSLVAAIIARTSEQGLTLPIPQALLAVARSEGWIALPAKGQLGGLPMLVEH